MYAIDWASRARRQLLKLRDRELQLRIIEAVGRLTRFPSVAGLEALADHRFDFRLRVGSHRVLFDADTTRRLITIQEVRKRNERTY